MNSLTGYTFVSSWSGGKDSCLALHRIIQAGGLPVTLLTMMTGDGERSRSHGLHPSIIKAQALSLNIPSVTCNTTWGTYEEVFLVALAELKESGIGHGVFGDIDLEPHRAWVERVCAEQEIIASLPLWQEERRALLREFIEEGFEAMIIAVSDKKLDTSFLGRTLDWQTIAALEQAGVDACGEEGEFHTVVTAGPLFSRRIELRNNGIQCHDGYSFLDVSLIDEHVTMHNAPQSR